MDYIKADQVTPICPHCEGKLDKVLYKDIAGKGFFGGFAKLMFMCPHCHKVLGFADADHG